MTLPSRRGGCGSGQDAPESVPPTFEFLPFEPAEEMQLMLERRGPIFRGLADAEIEIDNRPLSAVIAELVSLVT